jgi:cellobiose phosphorylase
MPVLQNRYQTVVIKPGEIELQLLASGDVFQWRHHDHQINLLQGNLIDGMIANLYLREKLPHGYRHQKLLGIGSPSQWQATVDGAVYVGQFADVTYHVHLIVQAKTWFYQVQLIGSNPKATYDLFYGQDVGIAHPFGILSNEAYTSQYIDHQVFHDQKGYTVLSRQNQGLTHYLQIGCDYPTIGYATDAMQFFGLSYKRTHQPAVLDEPTLPNQNYQYEFGYISLQTQAFSLSSQSLTITFYGHSHQEANALYRQPFSLPQGFPQPRLLSRTPSQRFQNLLSPKDPIVGLPMNETTLTKTYPQLTLVEKNQSGVLSGFLPNDYHLVTQEKELLVERPHGHILLSGDVLHASEDVFATTAYFNGVFGSHTVYGNTNFHKLTGDVRHPLNVHTIAGTRIWIKRGDRYQLLSMPSLFIMGLSVVTWIYQLSDDTITITLSVDGKQPGSRLSFVSAQKKNYDLLVSQQWLLDTNEYQHPITYTHEGNTLIIEGKGNPMIAEAYPHLRYRLSSDQPFTLTLLKDLVVGNQDDAGMVYLAYTKVHHVDLVTEATLLPTFQTKPEAMAVTDHYRALVHDLIPLTLTAKTSQTDWASFQALIPWYVHDALVHYASPHGLEQYNGAAWGTRDVLQGPFELFLTGQRFDLTREILIKVFSRQFIDSKEFPQWFMFDAYRRIQAHESHGDVLVWPLKALAAYLQATNDLSLLSLSLPYMDKHTGQFTTHQAPLIDHVWDIFTTIQASLIPGTHLPAYGGGDWDDTLQPANASLTKQMVSGWTVALLYEALQGLLAYPLFSSDRQEQLTAFVSAMKQDFDQYLVVDGVPAGFVIFHADHREVLLHPRDQTTGLNYRLLPFNRGIISQLFAPETIPQYQALIRTHLRHPDGVRLMNTAVRYQGGKKTYFQRAETAANFGREIGIQYVHAHIRYIEAMCTIGQGEEAWWGLNVINPINMMTRVPNAALRQRNVYFSSSDAAFFDRYQAKEHFEKVRQGTIPVKAGWRLYSSGPGIYLQTLIQKFLGIRVVHGELELDPLAADALKDLTVTYRFKDQPLTIHYLGKNALSLPHNRYRLRQKSQITFTSTGIHATFKS